MLPEQEIIHNKYVELIPQLNEAESYGQATKIIRENLDKNFGKDVDECKKTWQVTLRCVSEPEYHTFTVEAWTQREAEDVAAELAEAEGDYEDIDVNNTRELKHAPNN